jgi:RimJ/RimL family protein N-acetyltransferase
VKAPERMETARLVLRRPAAADAGAIFSRYARDPEVTRWLSWATHRTLEDTRAFVAFSDRQWERWPAGPYLIESRTTARLLGGTGLAFESATEAVTGYVLARDAWGGGYATEALGAMVALARQLGVRRLSALCHTGHAASVRVLEKCGFGRESSLIREIFPNLDAAEPRECFRYTLQLSMG